MADQTEVTEVQKVRVTNVQKHVISIGNVTPGMEPTFLVPGVPTEIDGSLVHPKTGHPHLLGMLKRGILVSGRKADRAANADAVKALDGLTPGQPRERPMGGATLTE